MTTKTLYLLDRNVVSIIKDSVDEKEQKDVKKLEMLCKLKEIDVASNAVSPILSLIEGQIGREESFEEKLACLNKETSALEKFFAFARTDSTSLQQSDKQFSLIFSEYREEDWEEYESFLHESSNLLLNKVGADKRLATRKAIIDAARKHGIYSGHIVVAACLSCLYGCDAARDTLKPHKSPAITFNVLNDLLALSRISLIIAVARQQGVSGLKIKFLTLDEGLREFLEGILIYDVKITASGVNQKVKYHKSLFPLLSEEEYLELSHEIC
jgi:hypothetical protein